MGGFDVIDQRYRALHERAVAVLSADPRILAVEVGGSVADGTADAWSDLDLQVITRPEAQDDVVADWPSWLATITPTVFARTPIAPFVVNTITDEGLTFDLSIWPGEAPVFPPPAPVYRVGMLAGTPFDDVGAALEYAVAEQLRGMAGPFISLVQREEHIRHLTGVPHLLGLLTTVFLAETGGLPPGKRWNDAYTDEQREAVAALPGARATRDGMIGFGMGVAELVVTRARPLYDRYDLEWPADLAAVVATRVRDTLGIETSSWLR